MTTTNNRRRRAGSQLSVDAIIDASLRLAERGGADAFTIRRLGEELGTDPTAIYRHFRDKDELTLAVADRVFGEIVDRIPTDLPWQETLRQLARSLVLAMETYPAIGVAMFARTLRRRNEFRAVELIIGALLDAGLDGYQAAVYYRMIGDTMIAYAGLRAAYRLLDPDVRAADESGWSKEYRMIEQDEFPNISRISKNFSSVSDDDILETQLDALILSVASASARHD